MKDELIKQIEDTIRDCVNRETPYKLTSLYIKDLIIAAGYVQLAEDQSLPVNPYGCTMEQEHDGYNFAIGSMLTPHKEGERTVKWVKVYTE